MMIKEMDCSFCGEPASCTVDGKPYCNKHYQKMKMYGTPEGRVRKRTNQYIVHGEVLEIITAKGDVILADTEDLDKIRRYSWCISKTGYAVANNGKKVIKMHRYILDLEDPDIQVDHRNRNRVDNRRKNLRCCTVVENKRNVGVKPGNRLGVLGIRRTPAGKYNVRIVKDRVEHHIGNFLTLEEAIAARNKAERKYHGEFASHLGQAENEQ